VIGMAHAVSLKVGDWIGKVTFLVVPLDDFNIILGNTIFVLAKAVPMPFLGGLLIMDEKQPCFVKATKKDVGESSKKKGLISAMQLKDGLRRGEVTYLAALREVKKRDAVEVPEKVAELLVEFSDVMPAELPKTLPPRRAVDHKIELMLGSIPPARVPYRMSSKELVELQNQLTELLEAGFVQPSKAPMVPLFCSRRRRMELFACVLTTGP